MKHQSQSKAELEQACLSQNILIERMDPLTGSKIYLPNLEKINKMIREFEFLVDGDSRGRAVNEISKIERFLYDHEDDKDARSQFLATYYSSSSMYVEEHRSLMEDKASENWKYLFVSYFKLEDIYGYFNRKLGASGFFGKYQIYKDMVELTYHVKLMDYLRSQVELEIPVESDKDDPKLIEDDNLKVVILSELGVIEHLRECFEIKSNIGLAKFLAALISDDSSNWRNILTRLDHLNLQDEKDLLTELNLNRAHEIFSLFGIKWEKE